MKAEWKPTPEEVAAAAGKTVRDIIAPGLRVLFCGINPGLYSGAVGHHFARPGNRFWPALHAAGFTERLLSPWQERELLALGCGITNIVARASTRADELSDEELRRGGQALQRKAVRYRPVFIAFLGITAYRTAFNRPKAILGRQAEQLGGSGIWVLPNPSGLNAHHRASDLARLFRELRQTIR